MSLVAEEIDLFVRSHKDVIRMRNWMIGDIRLDPNRLNDKNAYKLALSPRVPSHVTFDQRFDIAKIWKNSEETEFVFISEKWMFSYINHIVLGLQHPGKMQTTDPGEYYMVPKDIFMKWYNIFGVQLSDVTIFKSDTKTQHLAFVQIHNNSFIGVDLYNSNLNTPIGGIMSNELQECSANVSLTFACVYKFSGTPLTKEKFRWNPAQSASMIFMENQPQYSWGLNWKLNTVVGYIHNGKKVIVILVFTNDFPDTFLAEELGTGEMHEVTLKDCCYIELDTGSSKEAELIAQVNAWKARNDADPSKLSEKIIQYYVSHLTKKRKRDHDTDDTDEYNAVVSDSACEACTTEKAIYGCICGDFIHKCYCNGCLQMVKKTKRLANTCPRCRSNVTKFISF